MRIEGSILTEFLTLKLIEPWLDTAPFLTWRHGAGRSAPDTPFEKELHIPGFVQRRL
jgi:hypothetical protein